MSPDSNQTSHFPVPSFLGIGAQKAGTTWLWENIRIHPDLFVPRRKELHFLDLHWDRGHDWYFQHFRPRRVRRRRPGEITPAYLVVPEDRIEGMHALNPDMQLILMIRNPIERAWSAAKYFARNQMDADVAELAIEDFEAIATTPLMLQRGDYLEGLRRWGSVFPDEQMLVIFHDEVVEDPVGTIGRVFDHLEVDTPSKLNGYPLRTVFNAGPTRGMTDAHRAILAPLFETQVEGLRTRFADRQISWLADA